MSDIYEGRPLSTEEHTENTITDFIQKGYSDIQILNYFKQFPHIFSIAEEILNKKEPKSKPKSVKKMAKETSEFQRKIEAENEEWNKGRKEIKYLNVKPKRKSLLNLTVYIVTDKTCKHMEINTEILSDQLTAKMRRNILNVLSTDMNNLMNDKKC